MAVNPYAAHLGQRNAREVLASTASHLRSLANQLGADGLKRCLSPGKWSACKILCHLADCETVFAFRLRQAVSEPRHVIQPFDQDEWARAYDAYDAQSALAVFDTLRQWNLKFINSLPPANFEKLLVHPERGEMTFQVLIESFAGHDLNHLRQMESIAALA